MTEEFKLILITQQVFLHIIAHSYLYILCMNVYINEFIILTNKDKDISNAIFIITYTFNLSIYNLFNGDNVQLHLAKNCC